MIANRARKLSKFAAVTVASAVASCLTGQVAMADQAAGPETLEEVVITTARQREESLQKVPASITAITSETLQAANVETAGATGHALPRDVAAVPRIADSGLVRVAVCGAHMSGLPLNPQLTSRGGKLEAVVRSAPCYRFYALPGGPPKRPGMVRVAQGGGSIEMEVWSLPATAFGSFVTGIPSPLGIGTVQLENGGAVHGFVCEAVAAEGAEDITHLGSWRAFVNRAP